jgi:hypothetical protein
VETPDESNPWTPPAQSAAQVPPPDYGTPPPYGVRPPTDGFSIAALVLGILPFTAGLLGIVFGILGLRRTAGGKRSGRGMAIAGIVLGSLWLAGIGIATGFVATSSGTPHHAVDAAAPQDVDIDSLKVGECINESPDQAPITVPLVPCSQPHDSEVFAVFSLTGRKYPGDAAVVRFAQGGCDKRFDAYVGTAADSDNWDIGYYTPTADTWSVGDRRVFCTASHSDLTPLTGSVRA